MSILFWRTTCFAFGLAQYYAHTMIRSVAFNRYQKTSGMGKMGIGVSIFWGWYWYFIHFDMIQYPCISIGIGINQNQESSGILLVSTSVLVWNSTPVSELLSVRKLILVSTLVFHFILVGSVQVLCKKVFPNSGPPPLNKQNKHGLRPPDPPKMLI